MRITSSRRAGRRLAGRLSIASLAIAGVGIAGAAEPAAATANTYNVSACAGGYGSGVFGTWTGWPSEFAQSANCDQPNLVSNPDGKGDGLQVWSSGRAAGPGDFEYWSLTAPADTTITHLSYTGTFVALHGWTSHWQAYSGPSYTNEGDPVPSASGGDCSSTDCISTGGGSVAVNNADRIGFGIWCGASSCPLNDASSPFGPAGSANVWNATVTINEPSAPTIGVVAGTVYDEDPTGWISNANAPGTGWYVIEPSASDPAGVCDLSLSVVGSSLSTANNATPNYGSVTPCNLSDPPLRLNLNPCEPGGLGAGSYTSTVTASNPAGMQSSQTGGVFNVECSGPSLSVGTNTQNLSEWYSGPQTVEVDASDDKSGLAGNVSCDVGTAGNQKAVSIEPSQIPYDLPVTENGANDVNCTATNNVELTTGSGLDGQLRIDGQTPSVAFAGSTPAPAWVSGPQTVTVTGSETQQLSRIVSVSCQLDGGGWVTTDGAVASVRVSSDGVHTIACDATTGAGVKSPTETDTVQVDSVPPTVTFSNGPSQSTWATTAQSIVVTATKPQGSSGVAQISCTLNQQTTTYANSGSPASETVKITVQPPGGDLSCKAQDSAGNWSLPHAWNFLIDSTTPTGAFLATDPSDPIQVAVQVADSVSGVKGVQIELQTADGWQPLVTSFDSATGVATATIPDGGSLADGTYQLQALVWSLAGNEATITQGPTATPEEVVLPLRIVTQLLVGQARASVASCGLEREVLHRAQHAGRVPLAKLVERCGATEVPHARMLRLRYGQRSTVSGLLETIDGSPIPGQRIGIAQQAAGWNTQLAGSVVTGTAGRFTYVLPAGASRTVTFSYPGTDVLRSTSATTSVSVVGKGTISVGRHAVAGRTLRISGRLYGGYIPPDGVLIQLWYRVKGIPASFGPFDHAIHTNGKGVWSITFPVSTGARGYTYLFKAVIAQQTGWPFLATATNVVQRHVS